MPRIKGISGSYRFFFTSFDCNEPPHVHVERENKTCKFWLEPSGPISVPFWRHGMSTAARADPRIQEARVTKDEIVAVLADGRVVSVPLAWSWRLSEATPAQRANFRLIGAGQGIHWPEIDEDISMEGMLQGEPARRPGSGAAAAKLGRARRQAPSIKRAQPARKEAARG